MNEYDSNKINSLLLNDGYFNSSDIQNADLIVLNTCHISERKLQKKFTLILEDALNRIKQDKSRS